MSTERRAINDENQPDVKAMGKRDWDRPWTDEEEESWNRAQKAAVRGIVVVPEQIIACADEEVRKRAAMRAYNWEEYYKCHVASNAKFITRAHKEMNAQGFLDKYVYNYGVEQLPHRLKKIYYDAWLKQQSCAVSNVRSANNKAVQKAWCRK